MTPRLPSQPAPAGTPARIEQAGGWFQLSPFGKFRGANSVHVFDQGAAALLVAAFDRAKAGNRIPRGLPVYIGDPEADPKANPDRRKYGSILALEVRADGLYAQARWSNAGRDILANEHYDYVAPHWLTEPLSGQPGSVRPVALVSAGLTNWPPSGDARPVAANAAEVAAPMPSSVHAANTSSLMSLEPASDRFHRTVYQRMMATSEPQDKAWAYCAQAHKETYAAYQQETAANEAATTAANEAAFSAKQKRRADNVSRQQSIQIAVDEELARIGNDKHDSYSRAYSNVQRDRPELFAGMDEPAENTAPSTEKARLAAISKGVDAMRKRYPNPGDAYDAFKAIHPELFADYKGAKPGPITNA